MNQLCHVSRIRKFKQPVDNLTEQNSICSLSLLYLTKLSEIELE